MWVTPQPSASSIMRPPAQPEAFTLSRTTCSFFARMRAAAPPAPPSTSITRSTWRCAALASVVIEPISSGCANAMSAFLNREMIASATGFGGARPSPSRHLRPFHSIGLWLAVTAMPPSAPSARIMSPTVGVIATPMSTTSQPTDASAPCTARASDSPPKRPSRATTSFGRRPATSVRICEPNAAAKVAATTGVIVLPTMPRAPETESMRGASEVACAMGFSQGRARVYGRAFRAGNPREPRIDCRTARAPERYTRPAR